MSSVEITKAEISRDGPSLHLHFISTRLPYRPPVKWGAFNAVYFELAFEGVESISVRKFQSHDRSSQNVGHAGKILLTCEEAFRLSMTCQFMRTIKISGLLQSQ
ncbi:MULTISPECIES: Imm50 family immunity protein [Mesorhizobium]|uniref:Imm50 family immunity protein n=1 Tax=Mesorhizobium sp. TaxID=1871066 RepID=UPI000A07CC92|nr:MAG: hypothetical protein EOR82_19475 [Mesorhizobium sp.]TIO24340.1 MAG: hypothetical protein E5X83_17775 [Mesorhizobium sp.]TJV64818.1 MAG: hypothetical protein E5X82_00525 [Mesorhizobium sp.]